MTDVHRLATLQGFSVTITDVGDQMHFCQPFLSFGDDPALYFAHHLDWQNDPDALALADRGEASTFGTILPQTCGQAIVPGEGVIAIGAAFIHAAKVTKIDELLSSEIHLTQVDEPSMRESSPVCDTRCWIGVAKPALYEDLSTKLVNEARTIFDEALSEAALRRDRISERGDAALFLMRKSGPTRRDDLAIRQLAGARQNGEFDLYRRLLIRFAIELDTREAVLDERARRHVAITADRGRRSLEQWLLQSATLNFSALQHVDEQVAQHIGRVQAWKGKDLSALEAALSIGYFEGDLVGAPSIFSTKSSLTLKSSASAQISSGEGQERRMHKQLIGPVERSRPATSRTLSSRSFAAIMGKPGMLRTKGAASLRA